LDGDAEDYGGREQVSVAGLTLLLAKKARMHTVVASDWSSDRRCSILKCKGFRTQAEISNFFIELGLEACITDPRDLLMLERRFCGRFSIITRVVEAVVRTGEASPQSLRDAMAAVLRQEDSGHILSLSAAISRSEVMRKDGLGRPAEIQFAGSTLPNERTERDREILSEPLSFSAAFLARIARTVGRSIPRLLPDFVVIRSRRDRYRPIVRLEYCYALAFAIEGAMAASLCKPGGLLSLTSPRKLPDFLLKEPLHVVGLEYGFERLGRCWDADCPGPRTLSEFLRDPWPPFFQPPPSAGPHLCFVLACGPHRVPVFVGQSAHEGVASAAACAWLIDPRRFFRGFSAESEERARVERLLEREFGGWSIGLVLGYQAKMIPSLYTLAEQELQRLGLSSLGVPKHIRALAPSSFFDEVCELRQS
jgi:hypothetical protein